jgi:hypothetical protein
MFLFQMIMFVASFVLSQYLQSRQKIEDAKPSGMGDFSFPTATEGRVVPLVRGTCKISGPNVLWYGDLQRVPITKNTGALFGFDKDVITGYSYCMGMQMGLCLGEVSKLLRVWADNKLLWQGQLGNDGVVEINQPGFFGGPDTGGGGLRGRFRLHTGTSTQLPDPYLMTQFGTTKTPAYRGVCYITWEGPSTPPVFDAKLEQLVVGVNTSSKGGAWGDLLNHLFLDLYTTFHRPCSSGYLGTSSTIAPWAFEVQCIPNPLSLSAAYGSGSVNTFDSNPAVVLYEIMTNTTWGLGRTTDTMDWTSFVDAAEILFVEGNGISITFDTATEAKAIIDLIEEQIEGKVILNPRTGLWELRLIRQLDISDYDPTKELNSSNIISMDNVSRGAWDGTVNHVAIEFMDRAKEYGSSYAPAHDLGNVRIQGGRVVTANLNYSGVKTAALAGDIAWRELRTRAIPLLRCDVAVDRTMWDVLPCEVVYLHDEKRHICYNGGGGLPIGLPMRVGKIDWGQLAEGKIVLSLIQDLFYIQNQTRAFASASSETWSAPDMGLVALPPSDMLILECPYGFVRRGPVAEANYPWTGVLFQDDGALGYLALYKNNDGVYAKASNSTQFIRRGELLADIGPGDTTFSIVVSGTDSVVEMGTLLPATTAGDIGDNLANLVMIGSEYLAPVATENKTSCLECTSTYRGLLDTVPAKHSAGDPVWIIGDGGMLVNVPYPLGDTAILKLIPYNNTEYGDAEEATEIGFQATGRKDLPYPPNKLFLNTALFPASVTVTTALAVEYWRRNRIILNEVTNLSADAGVVAGSTYCVSLYKSTDGGLTWVLKKDWAATSANTLTIAKADLITYLGGSPPYLVRLNIRTTGASQILIHEFNITW